MKTTQTNNLNDSTTNNTNFRTLFDGLQPIVSKANSISEWDDSLTHQSFADECNINKIIERLDTEGFLADSGHPPQYFDLTEVPDFQSAMTQVAYAKQTFESYPAHIRDFFRNDPMNMITFLENPKNGDKAVELGLAVVRQDYAERSSKDRVEAESSRAVASQNSSSSKGKKTTTTTIVEEGE